MPRDSLADSSRTMINHGRRELFAAQKQRNHIGPIDPHALKIPARRAESLFDEIHPHLYAEPIHTKLARTIAMNGLVLMVASIFIGTHILGFFGISLPVVQVGGGLVVVSTGWALLRRSDDDDATEDPKKPCNETNYMRQAFYPLTMPLTVGPGSIAVAITVGANRTEGSEWRWPLIVGLLIGALVIAISIYLSYRFAERIGEVLGEAAMNVVIRLSSFILVCIGVQILWNGLSTLLRSILVR
jgi:multiple antibiotic resistance protein